MTRRGAKNMNNIHKSLVWMACREAEIAASRTVPKETSEVHPSVASLHDLWTPGAWTREKECITYIHIWKEGGGGNNLNERVQTDQAGGKTAGIIDGERKEEEKEKRKGRKELFRDKGGFTCLVSEIQHWADYWAHTSTTFSDTKWVIKHAIDVL